MPRKNDDENDLVGAYTQLVFECTVCKKLYKKPGVCNQCDVILKAKGG
ncbi:MAG: hypothetical protein HYT70_04505 [Candidatus Aenigmarchaeota archaeon]|nr:hypothetical protein [Candidatus Aenigmarchaeota archaeon]